MSRWAVQTLAIPSGQKLEIWDGSSQLSFREFFALLDSDSDFARWYSELLANCPLEAFFWELPPLTVESVKHGAEFVVIDSAALSRLRPDSTPFQPHFSAQPGADVIEFPNLGGDALLIVPAPLAQAEAYPHLAAFLRAGPDRQKISLWSAAACAGCIFVSTHAPSTTTSCRIQRRTNRLPQKGVRFIFIWTRQYVQKRK